MMRHGKKRAAVWLGSAMCAMCAPPARGGGGGHCDPILLLSLTDRSFDCCWAACSPMCIAAASSALLLASAVGCALRAAARR
jgi:hypothetical protein